MRSPFPQVADELRDLLGARLVAYIGGVQNTAVRERAEGDLAPSQNEQQCLGVALHVAQLITEADDKDIAQGLVRGDESPARRPLACPAAA